MQLDCGDHVFRVYSNKMPPCQEFDSLLRYFGINAELSSQYCEVLLKNLDRKNACASLGVLEHQG